ncbi:hypothetical protein [Methylobacterium symbioticum]|uniref:Uncharacterized protein n=1 Tax=Methylobacterium symbioticum TaxID=2584084 RepID=A0A509EF56_9HYPH|nr:hypothetical protein [Methylobacterium symbioticum]VUD72105.1 hypothetical protein MET9862_02699 [Methylobacterium symbioticum]
MLKILAATALAAPLLAVGLGAASAAPASDRAVAKVAEATSTVRPVAAEPEEEANCSRSRKRLWIEGEGWVVRRITTCR